MKQLLRNSIKLMRLIEYIGNLIWIYSQGHKKMSNVAATILGLIPPFEFNWLSLKASDISDF
jgi:lipid A disaccharide synthetase